MGSPVIAVAHPASSVSDALMRRYVLYVFALRASVAQVKRIPSRISMKPYVYVGYTSKAASERLEEHRIGHYVADRRWARHYKKPRPDLHEDWPTYATRDEALAGESELAEALRRRRFTVVNKTGKPIVIPPKSPPTPPGKPRPRGT